MKKEHVAKYAQKIMAEIPIEHREIILWIVQYFERLQYTIKLRCFA